MSHEGSGPFETTSGSTIRIEDYDDLRPPQSPITLAFESEDVARLIPVNKSAKIAFHEVASIVNADSGWNKHARKFIHILRAREELREECDEDGFPTSEMKIESISTGYFTINLACLPGKFVNGWVIGSGRLGLTETGVDLLITINGKRDDVRGRHMRVFYPRTSQILMLQPLPTKAIILNGEELRDEARMVESRMGLTIGNLTYRLEFTIADSSTYRTRLEELMREGRYWVRECHESFDPTPLDKHFVMDGYHFQTPQAAGAYGVVSACVKISTGEVFAVKRIQRTPRLFDLIENELAILERVGKHPHTCGLHKVIFSDGDRASMGDRSTNDVHVVLQPFAPLTFRSLIRMGESGPILTMAFHQGAQGIKHIHAQNIVHRDIKLDNLLIARQRPLRVVVADFGHATFLTNSRDHKKGTIAYHAPEITALKTDVNASGHWSAECDVFSYGLVGYELFRGKFERCEKGTVDKATHTELMTKLASRPTETAALLSSMLSWDAAQRPTMRQILLRALWPDSETPHYGHRKRLFEV